MRGYAVGTARSTIIGAISAIVVAGLVGCAPSETVGAVGSSAASATGDLSSMQTPLSSPSVEASPVSSSSQAFSWLACKSADLELVGGRQGETGVVNASVGITNTGRTPCVLPSVPARVELMTSRGSLLPLVAEAPASTPGPPVVVAPGVHNGAYLVFYWMNWCHGQVGPLTVRVTFSAGIGHATGSLEGPLLPRCDAASNPSTIQIDGISPAGR